MKRLKLEVGLCVLSVCREPLKLWAGMTRSRGCEESKQDHSCAWNEGLGPEDGAESRGFLLHLFGPRLIRVERGGGENPETIPQRVLKARVLPRCQQTFVDN